ncbi:Hypothetical predicted protein [Mytilus galloprovincialis]|uniref:Mab-21-like HhH/H2TH-like domain-containing protein n=2 Tax=Mytilus galloprovincialis TaxID=29158 RepID=A0A8B6EID5_MYTGA|nr:Hypothetical predicted protein [Mytilus galloprovincialis]
MEESIRQNASIALHRYLSHNITGTEKHVKTIRMMNNAKDYLQTMRNCTFITSGSFGEGLVMRGSDLDVMYVCKFAEVCEDKNVYFKPNITYFEMEAEDCQPCFVRLRLRYFTGRFFFGSFLEEMGGNYYLSNAKLKEQMTDLRCPTIHGPCLSDTNDTLDIALCFRSTSWIPQAQHWVTRSNNSWPSYDVKKSIIQHGVLFVPIGVKGSPKEDLDWRISFSVAEKILIYSFTHTQFLCYVLMKILLKDVIAIDLSCKELLCSYFMKTIVFWISEEISPSVWKPNNLIPLFMRCFRRLLYCVEYLVCPHFFVPENNLFENKINKYARVILLNKLHILNSYGWKCILFSDQIPNGHKLTSRLYKDQSCSHIDIRKLLFSRIFYISYQAHMRSFDYEKAIHLILSLESSKIKYLYLHFMSKFSCISDQFQPFEFTSENKFTYKKYNTRLSSLLQNMHHDAVSGWLMLASFFYKRKQYYIALDILQYSLSKCSSEKFYHGMNASPEPTCIIKPEPFEEYVDPKAM